MPHVKHTSRVRVGVRVGARARARVRVESRLVFGFRLRGVTVLCMCNTWPVCVALWSSAWKERADVGVNGFVHVQHTSPV